MSNCCFLTLLLFYLFRLIGIGIHTHIVELQQKKRRERDERNNEASTLRTGTRRPDFRQIRWLYVPFTEPLPRDSIVGMNV